MKIGVSMKVAVGYTLVVAVLGMAAWLMYGNTMALLEVDRASREMVEKRNAADSLVYSMLEVNNIERAVCLGATSEVGNFEASLSRLMAATARLRSLETDTMQCARLDTLSALLLRKRSNMALIIAEMGREPSQFYAKAVSKLKSGEAPVVIRPKTAEVTEKKETVYNVEKSKKGFFSRLADAFRGEHTDTVGVAQTGHRVVTDTVTHNIDIADTVANVISKIMRVEDEERRARRRNLDAKGNRQQLVGIQLAQRTAQLLADIRHEEQASLQSAIQRDLAERRSIMINIVVLSLLAVVAAIVLFLYIRRDIDRARRYSENLARAKHETERLMEQRERLLLTITHDIKAPAASISGFIDLMGDYVRDPKAVEYLRNIRGSATHLLNLVRALLDYHRLEKGKIELQPSNFSPKALVEECVASMRPQAEAKGLRIVANTSACGTATWRADSFRFRQVIDNLVSNAIKYTDRGNVIVAASVMGNLLSISVADTGKGMTAEECDKVFNAFSRARSAQGVEGVGLGLSITRELLDLLGGKVTVESTPGEGSVFTVVLPLRQAADESVSVEETATVEPQTTATEAIGERTILILDDDALQLQLLGEMLGRLSQGRWTVLPCRYVADAMEHLATDHPDTMIMDIEMPEMTGTAMIRQIDHSALKMVAMTAHDPSIRSQLFEAGFDACLFKPFTVASLAEVLGVAVPEAVEATPKRSSRMEALLAFADGDPDAEREILANFNAAIIEYRDGLKQALAAGDIEAIGRIAHKALPTMMMIESSVCDSLQAIAPEHIAMLSADEVHSHVTAVIDEMNELVD